MKDPTSKPSDVITDNFYQLASYNVDQRCLAASKITEEVEKSEDKEDASNYCLTRLVKGLASSRAASRVGFSVTLTQLINTAETDQILKVLDSAEKIKGEKNVKEDFTNFDFVQSFCCLAVSKGLTTEKVNDAICEKVIDLSLKIYDTCSHLQHIAIQTILCLSEKCNEDLFKSHVWPKIKHLCRATLENCDVNVLWLILGLRKIFPKIIDKKCPLAALADENMHVDTFNNRMKAIILKSANYHPTVHPGVIHIFERALDNEMMLQQLCQSVLQDGLLKHDNKFIQVYAYRLLEALLNLVRNETQMSTIFSAFVFEHILKTMTSFAISSRFSGQHARDFLLLLQNWLTITRADPVLIKAVVATVIGVATDFDRLTNTVFVVSLFKTLAAKTTAKNDELKKKSITVVSDLIRELCAKIDKLVSTNHCTIAVLQSALKPLSACFSHFFVGDSDDLRCSVLEFLAKFSMDASKTTEIRAVFSNVLKDCVETLHHIVDLPNMFKAIMSPSNRNLIKRLINMMMSLVQIDNQSAPNAFDADLLKKAGKACKKCAASEDNMSTVNDGFSTLLSYFTFMALLEPQEYSSVLDEIVTCYKEFSRVGVADGVETATESAALSGNSDSWLDVLIDLILSMLSKNFRHLRVPLEMAMANIAPAMKPRHLEPIFKVLNVDKSNEVMDADGVEDTDDGEDEAEEADNAESSSSSDDDEAVDTAPDPNKKLEEAVAKALKDADAMETASVRSDLSDDTMLRLDANLADVFRLNAAKSSGARSQASVETLNFRMRCFELLLILFRSIKNPLTLLSTVCPLLEVAKAACKSGSPKDPVFQRSTVVLHALCTMPLKDLALCQHADEVVHYARAVKHVFILTRDSADSNFQKMCANSVRFLLKLRSRTAAEFEETFFDKLKDIVAKNMTSFLDDSECLTSETLFNTLFEIHPEHFYSMLQEFPAKITDDKLRLFRRFDLCQFSVAFLRVFARPIFEPTKPVQKALAKFAEGMLPLITECLQSVAKCLTAKTADQQTDAASKLILKPKFVGFVVDITTQLARCQERGSLKPGKFQSPELLLALRQLKKRRLFYPSKSSKLSKNLMLVFKDHCPDHRPPAWCDKMNLVFSGQQTIDIEEPVAKKIKTS